MGPNLLISATVIFYTGYVYGGGVRASEGYSALAFKIDVAC